MDSAEIGKIGRFTAELLAGSSPAHPLRDRGHRGQGMSGDAPDSGNGLLQADPAPEAPLPSTGHGHGPRVHFKFFDELKRRNVVRVAILYLIACWLILEPTHVVFHMLEVPVWANRLVLVLMAIGFPPTLLFAWVYEITPEGLKPTVEVDPRQSTRAKTGQRLNRAILVVMTLGIAYLLVDRFWLSKQSVEERPVAGPVHAATTSASTAAVISEKSIAVLPFTDMSERKDQEYFADGMAEEMVDVLAKIPQLKVIGRVSSFQFKGQTADLSAVGEKLGAAYILRGSVRRAGSRIRVTAQLFDARASAQLWAESYDREFGDVLALQDQIASNIARALQLAVVMDDVQQLRRLKSPEAYALYLRGRSAYDRGEDGLREAQADFEQVLALEPTFPRAAEALALTHLAQIGDYLVSSRIGWQRAVDAANLALRLDPKSAFAHAILGLKLATYDYDWAGAARELERALAAESRDPVVLYNCSWLAFDLGRVDEALHFQDAALSLDPLNPDSLQNGAIIHYLLGNFELAERAFHKSLEVSPTFSGSHRYLGQILLLKGRPTEALKEIEAEGLGERDIGLALAYHALGRRVESDAALGRERSKGGELSFVSIATVHAYRGEIDQAFNWLDKAVAARDLALGHKLEHDPLLAPLRSDPRYLGLLREMHLRE